MKKNSFEKIRIIVLSFLIAFAFAMVVPVHLKMTKIADQTAQKLKSILEKQIGLNVSYGSLSPSILSSAYLKNIDVKTIDGMDMVKINKIKVTCRMSKLLKGDVQQGVATVVIDGIALDVEGLVNFIQYLQSRFSFDFSDVDFDLTLISTFIPGNVKLKNVSVVYKNEDLESQILLKELAVDNNPRRKSLVFDINSSGYCKFYSLAKKFDCGIQASGTVYNTFDGSNVNVKISNLTDGDIKLNKIALLASYNKLNFEAHTIQAISPLSISANLNLESNTANVRLRTLGFSPLNVISSNARYKELKRLKELYIDSDIQFNADLNTKKIDYRAEGNASVPKAVFPEGANLRFNLEGNEKKISLNELTMLGPNCNLSTNLSFTFKTMQTSGVVELPYFVLPNGREISTEIYFDPLDKGFMMFSPQTFIGNKTLTALQFTFLPRTDSYDFALEAYDYSHFDTGEPGIIKIDGSYLTKSKYLQSSISFLNLFADSVVEYGMEVSPEEVQKNLVNVRQTLQPFMLAGDAYVSSDFKSLSFNIPYIMIANTKADNQFLMLSLNGNEQSIQLNQLNFIYGKYSLLASASVEINPESKDMFYMADLNFESIPYHFSGTLIQNNLTLSGDYSVDGQVNFDTKNLGGYLKLENLPVNLMLGKENETFVVSLDSDFTFDQENGPSVNLKRFALEQLSTSLPVNPKLNLSGNLSKYGAQLSTIAYTDFYTALEGNADGVININDNILDSAALMLTLKNPLSKEKITLDATISNPDRVVLQGDSIKKNLYLSAQMELKQVSLNRFVDNNNSKNQITASAFATGTLEHPFIGLTVEKASCLFGAYFARLQGNATLEDKDFTVNDFNFTYNNFKISDIRAKGSLEDMSCLANCNIDIGENAEDLHIPLEINLSNTVMVKNKIDSFMLSISSKGILGNLVKKPFDFYITALYSDKNVALFSSDNIGLSGNYYKEGIIEGKLDNHQNLYGDLFCNFDMDNFVISLTNININLPSLFSYLNMDETLVINKGNLTGNFAVIGNPDDPDFDGYLVLENPNVKLPSLFKQNLNTDKIEIVASSNEIHVLENTYKLHNSNKFVASCDLEFNKGSLNQIDARIRSVEKTSVPLYLRTPIINLKGDFEFNIDYAFALDDNSMTIKGNILGDNVDVSSNFYSIAQNTSNINTGGEPINLITDLNITLGTHAALSFDPILRCVFVPNTKVSLKIDSAANEYNLDGELKLRSGDVAYLNRNFYIKSGIIKFNPKEIGNPKITFNAETRERDEKGQNVKIILMADNQYLSELNPKITSEPPKSELELQTMMGQILTADSEKASNFLFAAGDYAVQSLVFRQAENKLRDLLNFDIFSLRTNVLQNSLNMSLNNPNQELTFSNLLDNSTVYIGKYLGSSIYFDAMLRANFEENVNFDFTAPNGLLLPLDIGLELEAPFGSIRWNISQDMNNLILNGQFAPTASVSLMWKYTF